MASTINASNTGFGGIVQTGDSSGQLQLQTAGTTAVTVDTSQNVGIGTTSPSGYKLNIKGGNASQVLIDNSGEQYSQLVFQRNGTVNSGGDILLDGTNSVINYRCLLSNGSLTFSTSGSTPGLGAERMRIDSGGNVLIGSTSYVYPLAVTSTNNERTSYFRNGYGTGYTGSVIIGEATAAAGTGFNLIDLYSNGVRQFRVSGSGVIYAQNTTVQSVSDVRVKENIKDSTDGLDVIIGIRPVRFDFKPGFGNDKKNQLGFIAQEIEQVFPDAVDEASEKDENGNPYKSVGPGALIPVLVKAIQEQQAIIEDLKQRIETLEAK